MIGNPNGPNAGLNGRGDPARFELVAIAKAITGAYLSSGNGNAFESTRTASQIVQNHFRSRRGEHAVGTAVRGPVQPAALLRRHASGQRYRHDRARSARRSGWPPIQAACRSTRMARRWSAASESHRRSALQPRHHHPRSRPRHRRADRRRGRIGFRATGQYPCRQDHRQRQAVAFFGRQRRSDLGAELARSAAPSFASINNVAGILVSVPGYYEQTWRGLIGGTAYRLGRNRGCGPMSPACSIPARPPNLLVDALQQSTLSGTRAGQLGRHQRSDRRRRSILILTGDAYQLSLQVRAQIRRPIGSPAAINISVVDANGSILGLITTPDAPMFGADVAVQKARSTAVFLSSAAAPASSSATMRLSLAYLVQAFRTSSAPGASRRHLRLQRACHRQYRASLLSRRHRRHDRTGHSASGGQSRDSVRDRAAARSRQRATSCRTSRIRCAIRPSPIPPTRLHIAAGDRLRPSRCSPTGCRSSGGFPIYPRQYA